MVIVGSNYLQHSITTVTMYKMTLEPGTEPKILHYSMEIESFLKLKKS